MSKVKKTGRVVVITGATTGMGKTMADFFRKNGDTVCVLARSADPNIENNYPVDVSIETQVGKVFSEIGEKFGTVDILINNAGFGVAGATGLLSVEETNKIMDVNYFGVQYCTQHALKIMKAGAKIFNISSACALFALPYRTLYCATKAAVNMFSYGLRMELKPAGIDVCCICPGDVRTEFMDNRIKEYATDELYGDRVKKAMDMISNHPAPEKRMKPEVVAKAVFKQAKRKKTKPLVIVGGKYKVFYFLQRIIPTSAFVGFCGKYFSG